MEGRGGNGETKLGSEIELVGGRDDGGKRMMEKERKIKMVIQRKGGRKENIKSLGK